ncbi:HNH endonuclease [Spiroplasma endosymbiont of Cantharis rufa]|uniref:HNH endonuclease n=1 Tax=Spiroplasma endosymbiont of Cantharis rufa TaxID=3066279 RepID=UPI0030CB1499
MSENRKKWSKTELKNIWVDYIENKIWKLNFNEDELDNSWNLNSEAPCPYQNKCLQKQNDAGKMLRCQYQGNQNGDYKWSVDHIDGNPKNNNINNLWPMHPDCNKHKN